MDILVCVYIGLLKMLQAQYWVTAHFVFCLPSGAVELVSEMKKLRFVNV